MTAFLKIDDCVRCRRSLPWEWIPTLLLNGKPLAGTGVWRSMLNQGHCPSCLSEIETERRQEQEAGRRRVALIALLGGDRPCREFRFERYQVTAGNRLAYEAALGFNPATDGLYFWGSCGTGKTHLAWAAARRAFEEGLSVEILRPGQLVRRSRMREPEEEQAVIDQIVRADLLVLDDLGSGRDTPYARQLLQEILDRREFADRAGLIVTAACELDGLMHRYEDDAIPSRLAGACRIIEVRGLDHRLERHGSYDCAG